MTRFIVLVQNGAYVVHDNMDGDDSPTITRYSNAVHLAAQFNRQSERDAAYEASRDEHCRTFGRAEADRAQSQEIARMAGGGFLS
jgi:hypothetical protein